MAHLKTFTEEVVITVENHVGIITLNRPAALNALSFEMIQSMYAQLLAWQADDDIAWVLVRSNSPKAFCAGGDVRALHALDGDLAAGQTYFAEEYRLNHLTHHYAKPYVALMDGIVMGGGMGISQGATLRIVSDASRLAMPETAIGLIPDVGGSYFLSRTHENLAIGRYLALTGVIINAADACHWRLADVMVAQSVWTHLTDALIACAEPTLANLRAVAESFTRDDLSSVFDSMSAFEPAILDVFDVQNDLATIQASLQAYTDDAQYGEWASYTLSQIAYNSPVAMRLALHNQAVGRDATLGECLRMEFDSISNLLTLGEAGEGIRAKLVDKDNKPRWFSGDVEATLVQLQQSPFAAAQHLLADLV